MLFNACSVETFVLVGYAMDDNYVPQVKLKIIVTTQT